MPWATPTLRQTREIVRDEVSSALSGAVMIGNNVLRVMCDAMAGLCHLVLRYIDWLSKQLLPDTAETEWLDRHGDIWLTNADGSTGRKMATFATGTATFTGIGGTIVPSGTVAQGPNNLDYETTSEVTLLPNTPTVMPIRALDPGEAGNLPVGAVLSFLFPPAGVDLVGGEVVELRGGTDQEGDTELRIRVLERIRNPPMGGDAMDYVMWTKAVPGVTRAWCAPLEQGVGTVTVRFMMQDETHQEHDRFPTPEDITTVRNYLDSQRPVAIKDYFVVSPIPEPIDFEISNLVSDDSATRAAIIQSVKDMLYVRAAPAYAVNGVMQPAQTIYAAWVSEAILQTPGVESFTLGMDDHVMPNNGCLAVLGTISYPAG